MKSPTHSPRHCEPTGRREAPPDDRLREAIQNPGRHCERSEAIHQAAKKEWIASRSLSSGAHSRDPLARNDGNSRRTYTFSPRHAPEPLMNLPPLGGRGERRMPVAPAASCAMIVVERTRVTTSTPESPDVPARNGFNGFLRALLGDRALLPPSPSGYVFV